MRSLLLIPPFVRSSNAPPLGPAMLCGHARARGYAVQVLDLVIEVVHDLLPPSEGAAPSRVLGDHDKDEQALKRAHDRFLGPAARACGRTTADLRSMRLDAGEVSCAVDALACSPWADRARKRLEDGAPPRVVAVSVMFADQVLGALVVSRIVRELWGARVTLLWGGAHVAALAEEIARDREYATRWSIDGFVMGYAEETFVEVLEAVDRGVGLPSEVFRAGEGTVRRAHGRIEAIPEFGCLEPYRGGRLTLPAQVSRGCSYGRCAFCTYPYVEGRPSRAEDLGHVPHVVRIGEDEGAVVAFKDALLEHDLLVRLGEFIEGRVAWAGCTKLSQRLPEALRRAARGGCRTLEIGLETLMESSQKTILKRQPQALLMRTLDAAQEAGVRLVLNYITGFPGEDPGAARERLHELRAIAGDYGFLVEHHGFELERRAPLARTVPATRSWPWASVLEWDRLGEARWQEEAA